MAIHGIAAMAMAWETDAGQAADVPRPNTRVEIVRFADAPVTVVRGTGAPTAPALPPIFPPMARTTIERIAFADTTPATVTVLRGSAAEFGLSSAAVFPGSSALDFERIAEAVHGAESSYGTDPAMWRPDPDGPQGPMQVSAAAARDSGGGNRFDPQENRLLGRAYLARMFRRYGNWPDALAAYNWGPGNVDRWITGGRDAACLPLETIRYIDRVLREARIATSQATSQIVGVEVGGPLSATR